jgi:hypothetical protein
MPTDSLAELASQLQAFVHTEHPFTSDLNPATLQSIEHYARPLSPSLASFSQERAFCSVAQPLRSLPYLVEWADSQTYLYTAVQQLYKLLKHQTALGPASATLRAF